MHYSTAQKQTIADHEQNLEDLKEQIHNFKVYLHSPKFHEDTTIQVQDVLNHLANFENQINEFQVNH